MRRGLAAILLAALCTPCMAQRTYAVVSLVGDRMDIVQRGAVVGSGIDQNRRQSLPVADGAIDKAILAAADQALRKSDPGARPTLMLATDPALYRAQDKLLDEEGAVTALVEPMRPLLAGAHASHLILFTKYRHQASFPLGRAHVGNGMIEGAGFYVDHTLMTSKAGTNERARGFLAPFVYFQVSVIDLATTTVVKNQAMLGGTTRSAARGESGEAWDAIPDAQKINLLVRIARQQAFEGTTQAVASP